MKMIYNNVPVKSMRVHNFDVNSNDATMIASDLQSGVVGYARGKKVVGTGKCFSFASYGNWMTNESYFVPMTVNTVQIGSLEYPIKMTVPMNSMVSHDFTTAQKMAEVVIDGVSYPMTVSVQNNEFIVTCEKTINIQLFLGKDEYT